MEPRGWMLAAATGAIAVVVLWFALSANTGDPVRETTDWTAARGDDQAADATAEEPRRRKKDRKSEAAEAPEAPTAPPEPSLDRAADPELERAPEKGGLAFGRSVCDKLAECNCQARHPSSCSHDWSWVQEEDWSAVKCVLDLSCADVCRHHQHPQDVSCLVEVDKVHEQRLGAAPWRDNRGSDIPGIVTGKQELLPATNP